MEKSRSVIAQAVRHPVLTTIIAVVAVVALSVFVVIGALDASGITVFPLAVVLAIAMPVGVVPMIVYPLLAANRAQHALHAELARQARVDALTELPNRRAFFEFATQLEAACSVNRAPLTAMMIDVDEFKRINDSYGHDRGDVVLKGIAGTISAEVAATNATRWIVARLGGEEFVVLVDSLMPSAVARLAERICTQVRATVGAPGPVTVSVGVAFRGPEMGIDQLLKAADDAVYAAKRAGRNRWAFASSHSSTTAPPEADRSPSAGGRLREPPNEDRRPSGKGRRIVLGGSGGSDGVV